jgi:chromosome segregation ATPase
MPNDYESGVHIESALSVAHDLVDTVIRLKADSKLLADRVDSNANSAKAIIDERERQINALIEECTQRDQVIADLKANAENSSNAEFQSIKQSAVEWKANAMALKAEVDERNGEVDVYKAEIRTLNMQLTQLREQGKLDGVLKDEKNQEIDQLKKQVQVLTDELNNYKSKATDTKSAWFGGKPKKK